MNKKATIKILLDVFMTVIMLLLLDTSFAGLLFHEVAGIGILFFILIHNVLNFNFMVNISKNINKIKNKKQLFMYMLNIIITIGIILIVITGIFISSYILPNITASNINMISKLHHLLSYITLALIGVHILIHIRYLISSCKNIIKNINNEEVKKAFFLCFAIMFMCLIVYVPISSFLKSSKDEETSKYDDDRPAYVENSNYKSLDDYLSSLRCTGCNKHCLLISPRCNVGESQAQEATEKYNSGTISSDNNENETKSTKEDKSDKKNKKIK